MGCHGRARQGSRLPDAAATVASCLLFSALAAASDVLDTVDTEWTDPAVTLGPNGRLYASGPSSGFQEFRFTASDPLTKLADKGTDTAFGTLALGSFAYTSTTTPHPQLLSVLSPTALRLVDPEASDLTGGWTIPASSTCRHTSSSNELFLFYAPDDELVVLDMSKDMPARVYGGAAPASIPNLLSYGTPANPEKVVTLTKCSPSYVFGASILTGGVGADVAFVRRRDGLSPPFDVAWTDVGLTGISSYAISNGCEVGCGFVAGAEGVKSLLFPGTYGLGKGVLLASKLQTEGVTDVLAMATSTSFLAVLTRNTLFYYKVREASSGSVEPYPSLELFDEWRMPPDVPRPPTKVLALPGGIVAVVAGNKIYRLGMSEVKITQAPDTFAPYVEPPPTEYVGCFKDALNSNGTSGDLTGLYKVDGNYGTAALCAGFCYGEAATGKHDGRTTPYEFFGLQNGKDCYCGDTHGSFGSVAQAECNVPCASLPTEMCGGLLRNSVYKYNLTTPAPPTEAPDTETPSTDAPPTLVPTASPTAEPTGVPTAVPTAAPTPVPLPATDAPAVTVTGTVVAVPEEVRVITPAAQEHKERVEETAAVVGGVVAVTALLGGASVTAAPGNVMILSGVQCTSDIDDTEKMNMLLHPLGFSIDGVPAAGAIAGNVILWLMICVGAPSLVALLRWCGFGRHRTDHPKVTNWNKASSLIRYPSVMLPIPMLLFAGVVYSSFDITFNPRKSSRVNAIGYTGLFVCVSFVAVLSHLSRLPKATVTQVTDGRGKVLQYFLGSEEWVSHSDDPLNVERHGIVWDIYRELKWLNGNYFALELIVLFPLSALVAIKSNQWTVCVLKMFALAATLASFSVFIVWCNIFFAPFLKHVVVMGNVALIVGLLLHALAYVSKDMQHWGIEVGVMFFMGSMVCCLLRASYDVITYARDVYVVYKAGKEVEATCDLEQCESERMNGSGSTERQKPPPPPSANNTPDLHRVNSSALIPLDSLPRTKSNLTSPTPASTPLLHNHDKSRDFDDTCRTAEVLPRGGASSNDGSPHTAPSGIGARGVSAFGRMPAARRSSRRGLVGDAGGGSGGGDGPPVIPQRADSAIDEVEEVSECGSSESDSRRGPSPLIPRRRSSVLGRGGPTSPRNDFRKPSLLMGLKARRSSHSEVVQPPSPDRGERAMLAGTTGTSESPLKRHRSERHRSSVGSHRKLASEWRNDGKLAGGGGLERRGSALAARRLKRGGSTLQFSQDKGDNDNGDPVPFRRLQSTLGGGGSSNTLLE